MRNIFNAYQQAKVALAAAKGDKTLAELSSEHEAHPSQITTWKTTLETRAHTLFGTHGASKEQLRIADLERLVGQRDLEIAWMKKKFPHTEP